MSSLPPAAIFRITFLTIQRRYEVSHTTLLLSLMVNRLIGMHQNFPRSRFSIKLLIFHQNWHKHKHLSPAHIWEAISFTWNLCANSFHYCWVCSVRTRDRLISMPLVGHEEKYLFSLFLLPNLVYYNNNSYPTNIAPLKVCYPTFIRQKRIYSTLTLPEKSFTHHISLWPQPKA